LNLPNLKIPKLATINEQAKEDRIDFTIFAGSAGFLLDALQAGSSGGICALANVLGNELVDIYNAFKNNDMATAVALQKRIAKANQCVTSLYGVPALKAALDANGYYGGPCRSPIMKVRSADLQHTKNSFKTNGFPWMD
jgi:4-hydroxy-2-oxoglutarate aldolase